VYRRPRWQESILIIISHWLQKHHYRELEAEVREKLGKLPDGFVTYFLRRFPLLLPHVWLQMQQFRHEDILQAYYPHSFTFSRDDVIELSDDKDYDEPIPSELCDPTRNELFVKSKGYVDQNEQDRLKFFKRENGSPRKVTDWRSEARDFRPRQDDVRLRDRHHYKKKEKKKEEMPIWTLPPQ
jgi:serine/threonine-protein kinase/endoribonuclease IRE1